MTRLFDVADGDQSHRAKRRTTKVEPPFFGVQEEPKKGSIYRELPPPPLGTIDHTYHCTHPRCGAQCNDILEESGREWLLGCAFCGANQWVPVIRGYLQPKPVEFRFRDGRFEGLSPAEVAAEPRGLEYLSWAAESHPRQNVRSAVKTYLDASGLGR